MKKEESKEDSSKQEDSTQTPKDSTPNPLEEAMTYLEEWGKREGVEVVRGKGEGYEIVLNPPQSLVEKLKKKD